MESLYLCLSVSLSLSLSLSGCPLPPFPSCPLLTLSGSLALSPTPFLSVCLYLRAWKGKENYLTLLFSGRSKYLVNTILAKENKDPSKVAGPFSQDPKAKKLQRVVLLVPNTSWS